MCIRDSFKQQQFGTAGVEWANFWCTMLWDTLDLISEVVSLSRLLSIAGLVIHNQQWFTFWEVSPDWHESVLLHHFAQPSVACTNGQLHHSSASRHSTALVSQLGLHPTLQKLLLITRPAEGRRLSWPGYTVDSYSDFCCNCSQKATNQNAIAVQCYTVDKS